MGSAPLPFSSLQLSPILNRMTDTWHISNPTVINKNYSNANFLTLFVCLILCLIDSSLQPLPFLTQKIKSSLFFYKNNKNFCTIIMIFVGGISFSSSSSFFSFALFTISFFFFLRTVSILSVSLFSYNFSNSHLPNC